VAVGVGVSLLAACKKEEKAAPKAAGRFGDRGSSQRQCDSDSNVEGGISASDRGRPAGSVRDGSSSLTLGGKRSRHRSEDCNRRGSGHDPRSGARQNRKRERESLGESGKRVAIQGRSASAGLEETLTLEAYDDFPALVLVSASYRNSGDKPQKLVNVSLAGQRLNANRSDATAKPNEMYAFFGSSLKWGKDDVVLIPAKFHQENPFGVPVENGR
jgi:hypothetical protein